jgi:hypothetical protein
MQPDNREKRRARWFRWIVIGHIVGFWIFVFNLPYGWALNLLPWQARYWIMMHKPGLPPEVLADPEIQALHRDFQKWAACALPITDSAEYRNENTPKERREMMLKVACPNDRGW